MRKTLVLGMVAATAVGLALTAAPANATPGPGDTLVTFTVGTPGLLSITPGLYAPGTGSTNTVDGTIVSTVVDLRATGAGWTDTVSSTDFSLLGATSPSATSAPFSLIPAASAKIWTPTTVVAIPGTATITNDHASFGTALTLASSAATLLSAATTNANTATLTSNLEINTTGAAAGVFTGTLTQTVS